MHSSQNHTKEAADISVATYMTTPGSPTPAKLHKITEEATNNLEVLATVICEVAKEEEEVQRKHEAGLWFKPHSQIPLAQMVST
jgi:hypothetical protein